MMLLSGSNIDESQLMPILSSVGSGIKFFVNYSNDALCANVIINLIVVRCRIMRHIFPLLKASPIKVIDLKPDFMVFQITKIIKMFRIKVGVPKYHLTIFAHKI